MMPRHGSAEDQRIKAEMEARNCTISTPHFRGPGTADVEERVPLSSQFEIGTLMGFIEAATSGKFPGNRQTELPLWPRSELENFSKPYKDWATPPYSDIPTPAGPFGNMPGPSPPAIFRVMNIISGIEALMWEGLNHVDSTNEQISESLRGKDIERSFKLMRTKIWFGLCPMPEAHWTAKGLDDQVHIEEALSVLQSIIDVFDYLRRPDIQGSLRQIHNKVHVELDVFQDASNSLHATRGERMPGWSISKLWQEYIRWHFDFMEKQARAFLLTHLKKLQLSWKARLLVAMTGGRQINETQATIRIDHQAIFILNKIEDLYLSTDLIVRARVDGFAMSYGVEPRLASMSAPEGELNAIYAQMEEEKMRFVKTEFNRVLDARVAERRQAMPTPDFMESMAMVIDREFAHKATNPDIDDPPSFATESWVRTLGEEKVEIFGVLIYRLSYKENDEEWAEIRDYITKEIESGWEGVVGAENVKKKAVLRWMDGRKVKLEEGDLDGARKHFKEHTIAGCTNHIPKGLTTTFCLAITPFSLSSHILPHPHSSAISTRPPPGDFRPFIHAIDPSYEPFPSSSIFTSSRPLRREPRVNFPLGFTGTLLIPPHLIYTELFALKATGCGPAARIDDLWVIARAHPWGVYTGPTTGIMRRDWRELGVRGMAGLFARVVSRGSREV